MARASSRQVVPHLFIFFDAETKKEDRKRVRKNVVMRERSGKRNEPVGDHVQDGSKLGGCQDRRRGAEHPITEEKRNKSVERDELGEIFFLGRGKGDCEESTRREEKSQTLAKSPGSVTVRHVQQGREGIEEGRELPVINPVEGQQGQDHSSVS